MRVAIVSDHEPGEPNGAAVSLAAILSNVPPDLDVRLYTLQSRSDIVGARHRRPLELASQLRCLHDRLVRDEVDMIHLGNPGLPAVLARRVAGVLGIPLVATHRSLPSKVAKPAGPLRRRFLRWLYEPCVHVLVPSECVKAEFVDDGWQRNRFVVCPPGVDRDLFSPARRSAACRAAWRTTGDRPAIMYAGRLASEKGVELLPLVQRLLLEYRMPHRFVIVGDGPMRSALRDSLPEAIFLGELPHDRLGEVMASCDLLLAPGEGEGAGTVTLEAQAAGLPVVAPDRGASKDLVIHGKTGFVCRAGSEQDFCRRVAELLVDAPKRAAMSAAAREHAVMSSWLAVTLPVLDCYRRIVRIRSAPGVARAAAHPRRAHV